MTVLPFATQINNACAAIEANSPIEGEVIFCVQGVQGLLFVNLVRRVRCDPPQDTVQSDRQSMGSGAAISPPGFDAKTMHRLSAPLPQTGYDAPACKTNVQDGCRGNDGS